MSRNRSSAPVRLNGNRPLPNEEMARLYPVLRAARKRLNLSDKDHVYIGPAKPGSKELVIRVYKDAAEHDKPPSGKIRGYRVKPYQFVNRPQNDRAQRSDRILGGIQTGNETKPTTPGTLGAVVFDAQWNPMALSNHHVYSESRPKQGCGDPVVQPAKQPLSFPGVQQPDPGFKIGTVVQGDEALDCAVATLDEARPFSSSIAGIPGGIKGVVDPAIGMIVMKSGCGSAITRGIIDNVSENCFTIVPLPGRWMDLSVPGDSGSVWLEAESHAAVGLHHAGEDSTEREDERAYAIPIRSVKKRLGIELCRRQFFDATSTKAPAVVSMDKRMLVGWVDRKTLTLRFAGATLHRRLRLDHVTAVPIRSDQALSLCHFGGRYYCAYVGVRGENLYVMSSRNGRKWQPTSFRQDTEPSSPALAVINGRLHLAWHGTDERLYLMRTSDGKRWSRRALPTLYTASGPALTSFKSRLFMAWEGAPDHRLNVLAGNSILRLPYKTDAQPCLHEHEGRLYLAWRGADDAHRLHIISSADGRFWSPPIVLQESAAGGPALGSLNENGGSHLRRNLVWFWTDGDETRDRKERGRLSSLLYDLWQPPRKTG